MLLKRGLQERTFFHGEIVPKITAEIKRFMQFFLSGEKTDNSVGYDGAFVKRFVVLMKHRLTHPSGCLELNKRSGRDRDKIMVYFSPRISELW